MDQLKNIVITPAIYAYLLDQCPAPDPIAGDLIGRTARLGAVAEMQIPHEEGLLLTLLARLLGARRIVEVGTFTGYSTLCLARGLSPGGTVSTCDLSPQWLAIATQAWQEAKVIDQITVLLGPADHTLGLLPDEPIDLVFLDADKAGYIGYWEQLIPRVRPGGLLLADNVLYAGKAANPHAVGNAAAIRAFNAHVRADPRVDAVMLPVADGLTIARKK